MRANWIATLLLAACGGGGGEGMDMAVPVDMAVPGDLATPSPDLAMAPTTGQLTLTDVAGTFYFPGQALTNTHVLLALVSLPVKSTPSQYTDADYNTTPGSLHGCSVNRYDSTVDGGAQPGANAQAGAVTLSGFDAMHLVGLDANANTGAPPNKIVCVNPDTSYSCYYGGPPGTDGGSSLFGDSSNGVVFPTFPLANRPPGAACDEAGHPGTCEQHPIPLGGTTNVIEDIAGGVEFGAVPNRQISTLPDGLAVASIAGGGAKAAASNLLDDVVLDPTQDLVITWTCPEAGGCPVNFVDVVAGLVVASTNARDAFAFTPQYGQATCVEQSSNGKLTLRKEAIKQLLGSPQQSSGSVLIVLTRLKINLAGTNGHTVYLTAGHGVYGFSCIGTCP
jgi:hypothetical protein